MASTVPVSGGSSGSGRQSGQRSSPSRWTKPVARRSCSTDRSGLEVCALHRSQSIRVPDALEMTATERELPRLRGTRTTRI
jgi:hypothetical protein